MALCTSNVTSGFIDLATFDEIEKYLYGGDKATAYFVRETRKSTWFTQVPVCLSRAAGQPAFGQEFSFQISRAGDYLLQTWLRLTTPAVQLLTTNAYSTNGRLRWTRNFMHNLVRECSLTFNDLTAARFDHYHLDFWAAFTVPAGKQNAYANMIGDFAGMTQPHAPGLALGAIIPAYTLNLPLPFFYSRDSGVALPTAALPYNDMRINFSFRNWNELLILDDVAVQTQRRQPVLGTDVAGLGSSSAPIEINNCQLWANYAIVSNDERKRMGCAPRDILIEQCQTAPRQTFVPSANGQRFDIRFSHAVKVLFFAVRNSSFAGEWSNYTAASPIDNGTVVEFKPFGAPNPANGVSLGAADPILQTSLIYENTNRLAQMGSDYFSLVNPYYTAVSVPDATGYHAYSYSLDFYCLDPMGSTNYGKLTNVSIVPEPSPAAQAGALGGQAAGTGMNLAQQYEFVVTAVNNNIVRIAGGALGFPVL
jgi:hypothetical protein